MISGPQVKAVASRCFPDHDYADWHFGVDAVEQLGGFGPVPNEFTLELRNGESTFAYGAKKVTNGHLVDTYLVVGHGAPRRMANDANLNPLDLSWCEEITLLDLRLSFKRLSDKRLEQPTKGPIRLDLVYRTWSRSGERV
jgi:hypothetical protein